jgi:hypothetical protein
VEGKRPINPGRTLWLLALLASSPPVAVAGACGDDIAGARQIENSRYIVAYALSPALPATGKHFVVDLAVCPQDGAAPPQSVRVDATMPEHRHGMNYKPTIVRVKPGQYRAEGLMFHMSGRWELTFDLMSGGNTVRLADSIRLE